MTGYWDQNVYVNNVLKSSISTSKIPFIFNATINTY